MKRIPLIIGANPRNFKNGLGPLIPLGQGAYRVNYNGYKDSVMSVVVGSIVIGSIDDGYKFDIIEFRIVQLKFDKVGTETNLSVYLEKVA